MQTVADSVINDSGCKVPASLKLVLDMKRIPGFKMKGKVDSKKGSQEERYD